MEVNMSSMTWMKLGVQLVGVASPVSGEHFWDELEPTGALVSWG